MRDHRGRDVGFLIREAALRPPEYKLADESQFARVRVAIEQGEIDQLRGHGAEKACSRLLER